MTEKCSTKRLDPFGMTIQLKAIFRNDCYSEIFVTLALFQMSLISLKAFKTLQNLIKEPKIVNQRIMKPDELQYRDLHINHQRNHFLQTLQEDLLETTKLQLCPHQMFFHRESNSTLEQQQANTFTKAQINQEIRQGKNKLFKEMVGMDFSNLQKLQIRKFPIIYTLQWLGFMNAPVLTIIDIFNCRQITSLNPLKKIVSKNIKSLVILTTSIRNYEHASRIQIISKTPVLQIFNQQSHLHPTILKALAKYEQEINCSQSQKNFKFNPVIFAILRFQAYKYIPISKGKRQKRTIDEIQAEKLYEKFM